MPLLTIIVVIAVVGVALYAINRWLPMQPTVKSILNVAVIIILVLWPLKALGVLAYLTSVRV